MTKWATFFSTFFLGVARDWTRGDLVSMGIAWRFEGNETDNTNEWQKGWLHDVAGFGENGSPETVAQALSGW